MVKKHLIEKSKKDDTVQTMYGQLLCNQLNLKYVPINDGPTEYFKSQKVLNEKIKQLGVGKTTVLTSDLIAFKKDAFLNSIYGCTCISIINSMWDTDDTQE